MRMPSPQDERRWAALFFLVGLYMGLVFISIKYARHFWATAGSVALTVAVGVVVIGITALTRILARYMPTRVSYALAATVWALLFLLAFTGLLR
jgi:hypothetical protein